MGWKIHLLLALATRKLLAASLNKNILPQKNCNIAEMFLSFAAEVRLCLLWPGKQDEKCLLKHMDPFCFKLFPINLYRYRVNKQQTKNHKGSRNYK